MSNKYSIGTHCFFGNSPLNFWSSLDHESIIYHLNDITGKGFNTVYILIPWAAFIDDTLNDPQPVERTMRLYETFLIECLKCNLVVHARIGYLWESAPSGTSTFHRLTNFFSDNKNKTSFQIFLQSLREVEIRVSVTVYYFFSWEDFYWPIYVNWRNQPPENRIQLAIDCKYDIYCNLNISASRDLSGSIAIPGMNDVDGVQFSNFFDSVLLTTFFQIAAESGIDIGFEYRIDSDLVNHFTEGENTYPIYYHWQRSHPFIKRKYIYFHQNIGTPIVKKQEFDSAISQLEWVLRTWAPLPHEYPLTIDQFNFIDTTETSWSKLNVDSVDAFLKASSEILKRENVPVALWSYIDWRRDVIHNGTFKDAGSGWTVKHFDGAMHSLEIDANGLILFQGITLTQTLSLSIPGDGPITLLIDCITGHRTHIKASLGLQTELVIIQPSVCNQEVLIIFERFSGNVLQIVSEDSDLKIKRIMLYDRIYSQGGKTILNKSTSSFTSFSNSFLSKF